MTALAENRCSRAECGHNAEDHTGPLGLCWHIMSEEEPLFDCQCEGFLA